MHFYVCKFLNRKILFFPLVVLIKVWALFSGIRCVTCLFQTLSTSPGWWRGRGLQDPFSPKWPTPANHQPAARRAWSEPSAGPWVMFGRFGSGPSCSRSRGPGQEGKQAGVFSVMVPDWVGVWGPMGVFLTRLTAVTEESHTREPSMTLQFQHRPLEAPQTNTPQ